MHCHTLRSWLHEFSALIMTSSPGLENNDILEWSSNSFPGTTSMSGCLHNCQKYILKSCCSPIQGQGAKMCKNKGSNMSCTLAQKRVSSSRLENSETLKWICDRFPGTLTNLLFLENCWNSTPMYSFSPFQGTK